MEEMERKLEKAKELLAQKDTTFACILQNGEVYTSEKKGIAPIMDQMKIDREFFRGTVAADRFLGKAAAMLLIDSGVCMVYGETISEHAKTALEQQQKQTDGAFSYQCRTVVPYIINRTKTGMCPMEKAVLDVTDPKDAFDILKEALARMAQAKKA